MFTFIFSSEITTGRKTERTTEGWETAGTESGKNT